MQLSYPWAEGMLPTMRINATQSRLNEMNVIRIWKACGGRGFGRQCFTVAEIAGHSLTGAKLVRFQHVDDNAAWWQSGWRLCPTDEGCNAGKQQKNAEAHSFDCLAENVWEHTHNCIYNSFNWQFKDFHKILRPCRAPKYLIINTCISGYLYRNKNYRLNFLTPTPLIIHL